VDCAAAADNQQEMVNEDGNNDDVNRRSEGEGR